MMCVVQREFKGNGEIFVRNQLVESGTFRNGETLVRTRYLRPASDSEIRSARPVRETPKPTAPRKGLKARVRRQE